MPNTRIVIARGAIDGVNTVFSTGEPYVAGSTAYILNGRIHNRLLPRGPDNDYGYIELSADAGTIQVDHPPLVDDVVQIFYWDRKVAPAPAVQVLTGTVSEGSRNRPQGVIREQVPTRLAGVVRAPLVQGVVRDATPQRLAGVVRAQRIVGVIKDKCP